MTNEEKAHVLEQLDGSATERAAFEAGADALHREQWKPIADAPKGRPILVRSACLIVHPFVVWFCPDCWLATDGDNHWPWTDFSVYAELPPPPEGV